MDAWVPLLAPISNRSIVPLVRLSHWLIFPWKNKVPSVCSAWADGGVRPYVARLPANSHIFRRELNSKVGIFKVDAFTVKSRTVIGVA